MTLKPNPDQPGNEAYLRTVIIGGFFSITLPLCVSPETWNSSSGLCKHLSICSGIKAEMFYVLILKYLSNHMRIN